MGPAVGLTWTPVPPPAFARLGQEGWPLADYLLREVEGPLTLHQQRDHARRCAALRALMESSLRPKVAHQSLRRFDNVLAQLPRLAPKRALVPEDAPPGPDAACLDPMAHSADPDQAAIIGVIDHAIPFAHPLLTTATGHSRVAAVWMMDGPARDRRPDIPFGQELRGTMIDALRRPGDEDAPYRACGLLDPGGDMALARAGSHGAAVATIAAGQAPGDPAGRAHPVIGVSLPRFALADTSGSLGALFIQAAVIFVISRARMLAREMSQRAGRRVRPPLVVNLSLGVSGGAQDGSGMIARLQDAIAGAVQPDLGPVHFVLPTGNACQDRLNGQLQAGEWIHWQIVPDDPTPSAIEIWAPPGGQIPRLRLRLPGGEDLSIPLERPGMVRLADRQRPEVARAVLQHRGRTSGYCLTLIVPPTLPTAQGEPWAPAGLWSLTLSEESASPCRLAIARDDRLPGTGGRGRQSRLVEPEYNARDVSGRWQGADPVPPETIIRRNGTVNSYATGRRQIRVGSTMAHPAGAVAHWSGLLADGAAGDVTAPSERSASLAGMAVPGVRGAGLGRLSGTSLSAPQMTRWLAVRLAAGQRFDGRADLAADRGSGDTDVHDLGLPDLPWRSGLGG